MPNPTTLAAAHSAGIVHRRPQFPRNNPGKDDRSDRVLLSPGARYVGYIDGPQIVAVRK